LQTFRTSQYRDGLDSKGKGLKITKAVKPSHTRGQIFGETEG